MREVQLTATSEPDFSWEIPNPGVWQKLRTVAYASKLNYDGPPTWPQRTVPGRHLNHMKEYFYQSGNKFFFNCYGGMNALLNLSSFMFPRRLVYQPVASRLVTRDEEEYMFEYDPSLVPDEEKATARVKTTNTGNTK